MNATVENEKIKDFLKRYNRGFRDGKNSRIQREDACRAYKLGYAEGDKYRIEVVTKMHAAVANFKN